MEILLFMAALVSTNEQYAAWEKSNPGAGYSVHYSYDKSSKEFTGEVKRYGRRTIQTPMQMPEEASCVFCNGATRLRLSDITQDVIRSQSERILLVPKDHIPHWFLAAPEQQLALLQTAVKICQYIETKFANCLTSKDAFKFALHVGTEAGQTVPHLHLRFEGGNGGKLTNDQWKIFKNETSSIMDDILAEELAKPAPRALAHRTERDPAPILVTESNADLLRMIEQKLDCSGLVRQTDEGFTYLDIDDAFIHDLFPKISADGVTLKKPDYFKEPRAVGAHISIITSQEKKEKNIASIAELGKKIAFTVTAFAHVDYKVQNSVKRVYYLIVEAPELEAIRQKYGLNPKKEGREFSITLAHGLPNI